MNLKNIDTDDLILELEERGYFVQANIPCHFCSKQSEFNGAYGNGLIRWVNVCPDHAHMLRGYEKHKEEFGLK